MTFDEICSLAATNTRPEDGATCVEWLAWYVVRDIYDRYKRKEITRERGEELKREAKQLFDRETRKVAEIVDQAYVLIDEWTKAQNAAMEYMNNKTEKNIGKLIDVIMLRRFEHE